MGSTSSDAGIWQTDPAVLFAVCSRCGNCRRTHDGEGEDLFCTERTSCWRDFSGVVCVIVKGGLGEDKREVRVVGSRSLWMELREALGGESSWVWKVFFKSSIDGDAEN